MDIGLLCMLPELYSHRRLAEAARGRGHTLRFINPLDCQLQICATGPTVLCNGMPAAAPEVIIPRIGASITFHGVAVLRHFEQMGSIPLNASSAVARARDKLHALQLFNGAGIPLPATAFGYSNHDPARLVAAVGGPPVVVKVLDGARGDGVVLAETLEDAHRAIRAFQAQDARILVQAFVQEARGRDIRCLVIGEQVIAAMERRARTGEFRANLHQGGAAHPVEITGTERMLAIRAAGLLGLDVAGVDLLRTAAGPLVLEVNASPGLEGIEHTSGLDVAGAIVAQCEAKERSKKAEKRP